jgi:hypothetical protein
MYMKKWRPPHPMVSIRYSKLSQSQEYFNCSWEEQQAIVLFFSFVSLRARLSRDALPRDRGESCLSFN